MKSECEVFKAGTKIYNCAFNGYGFRVLKQPKQFKFLDSSVSEGKRDNVHIERAGALAAGCNRLAYRIARCTDQA